MNAKQEYDYIIAGMGCAGLSLAIQLKRSGIDFTKVLIIDRELKNKNDRTWCFWTKQKSNWFDEIVSKRWNTFEFKGEHSKKIITLFPYQYMLVKGIDFYNYCLNELKSDHRFELKVEEISSMETNNSNALLKSNNNVYTAKYIFNSAIRTHFVKDGHVNYVQHFKGLVIETENEAFNEECPVFMDFSVNQKNDCRFVYIIPFSKTTALVEYTGFSEKICTDEEYDFELENYISNTLHIKHCTILETEKGVIPMAESEFINPFGNRVINMGTAGGYSKPSSGYTFYFIQKNIQSLISQIKNNQQIKPITPSRRYRYYDKILLDVINTKSIRPSAIFEMLFLKNKSGDLLSFLNEESTLAQDLGIMNSVPITHFMKSAIKKW